MQTINGIGIKLYGKLEKLSDRSYIATKWFVFLFFPIIPLGSYRVWPEMEFTSMPGNTVMTSKNEKIDLTSLGTKQRLTMQRVKWQWKQILRTYIVGFVFFLDFSYNRIGHSQITTQFLTIL